MADGIARVPLPDGKIYHFNIIYNHARSPMSVTPDTVLSKNFTERVAVTLESLGFVNSYYHDRDALPGRNVFTELFRVVDGSDYTIVVLTLGFVADCWKRYTQMSAFKTLLDVGQSHKFLPISVGLSEADLPQELNTESVLFFQEDWESDEQSWNKLKRVFVEQLPVPEAHRDQDLYTVTAYQETNAPDGALADHFDGDDSGRHATDHSINHPENNGETPATGRDEGGSGGNRQDPQNRNVPHSRTQDQSEVSVGRTSLAHRDETDSAAGQSSDFGDRNRRGADWAGDHSDDNSEAQQPGTEDNTEQSQPGTDRNTEQSELEPSQPGADRNTEQSELEPSQPGADRNTEQSELATSSTWNTELHNDGVYEGVSMNLQRRQVECELSVNLQQRQSRPADRNRNQNYADSHEGSLRMDGEDIETSVVNRLERRGMLEYRQEMLVDQTKRKCGIDSSSGTPNTNLGQTSEKVIAVTSADAVNSPSSNEQPSNISLDISSGVASGSSFVQNIVNTPGQQIEVSPSMPLFQGNNSTQGRDESHSTSVTKQPLQGISPTETESSALSGAEQNQNQNTISEMQSEAELLSPSSPVGDGMNTNDSPGLDEAKELETILYETSLPPLDDSGVDTVESRTQSTDNSFTESLSPEEAAGHDLPTVLNSSDRGIPDGSVEDSETMETIPGQHSTGGESSGESTVSQKPENTKERQNDHLTGVEETAACEEESSKSSVGGDSEGVTEWVRPETVNRNEKLTSDGKPEEREFVSASKNRGATEKVVSDHELPSAETESGEAGHLTHRQQTERQELLEQKVAGSVYLSGGNTGTGTIPDLSDMNRDTYTEEKRTHTAFAENESKSLIETNDRESEGLCERDSVSVKDYKTEVPGDVCPTSKALGDLGASQMDKQYSEAGEESLKTGQESIDTSPACNDKDVVSMTENQESRHPKHTPSTSGQCLEEEASYGSILSSPPNETEGAGQGNVSDSSSSRESQQTERSLTARILSNTFRFVAHAFTRAENPFYV